MDRFRYHNIIIIFLISSVCYLVHAEDNAKIDPWKIDLQILLGFSDDKVDGVMDQTTFEALKLFAKKQDITDVVLRGEFEDLGFWGFQQYIMKYNQYWIRELKNRHIIDDVLDKEYLRQADETLYSFEMSIQNAQLEVERLIHAKSKAKRMAKEKQEMDKWKQEKLAADRIITALNKAIITAEDEAGKWSLERIRALRLAEEQEQLARLEERKLEASIITLELEDVIMVAKREIDRLIDENNKLKTLIVTSTNTNQLAEELKAELKVTRMQMDSLYVLKDSLEIKLQEIEVKAVNKSPQKKKKRWYKRIWPFGKK